MVLKRRVLSPVTLVMLIFGFIAIAVVMLSLTGPRVGNVFSNISNSLGSASYNYANEPVQAGEMEARDYDDVSVVAQASTGDGSNVNEQQSLNRVILKSASLRIVVEAADSSLASIATMAEEMGGWVVTSSTSMVTTPAGQQVAQGSITIRVPSDRLDETLSQIKSGAGKVEYESVSGQDVTQEYIDLNSRLTNLEAAEEQLRSIMDEARRTEDVLTVYNQLVNTRGEIERIRGQLQYYEEASAYSSISIDLIPKAIETPILIAGWSPGRTVENALASLINVLQWGADVLITIAVLVVPLVLIVGIPAWFIRRTVRRRAAQSVSAA